MECRAEDVGEVREVALGRTNADRWLFIVFAVRGTRLRPISARNMTRRERKIYEQAIEQASS